MSVIVFHCPACNREIKTTDKFAGRRARCPQCAAAVTVPNAPGTADTTLAESSLLPPVPAPLGTAGSTSPAAAVDRPQWKGTPPPAIVPTAEHDSHDDDYYDDDEEMAPLVSSKSAQHEDLIDMTAMVDIVFFLLIFFLTTSLTSLQAVMDLPTPQSATEKRGSRSIGEIQTDSETLIVKIQDDNSILVDDEEVYSDHDLRTKIRTAVSSAGGTPLSLVVIGNADANHGTAVRVFDAGAAAGVGSISLLVQDDTDAD
ncbi:Biopolymer transport protein ExbD/TolR [Anatilimnocola aggregata]|uniref:Biopolymer transport protein ExbD/TolR n=1 Tax=Anatilimnocola aggregata TaxID=2528021 RepID=A0A517YBI4_9BACT|nr:biopolymer transporter ExbD [Anatilimnocola aggregata]QDU27581.1 Biopolymer transport protein ExbD/TolR [Anatilimnocola aggregata]